MNGQYWVQSYTDALGNTTTLTYNATGATAVTVSANASSLQNTQKNTQSGTAALNGSATGTTQTQSQGQTATLNSSGLGTTETQNQSGAVTINQSDLGTTETQTQDNTANLDSGALATTQVQEQSETASLSGAGVLTTQTQSQNNTVTLNASGLTNSETQSQQLDVQEYPALLDGLLLSTTGTQVTNSTAQLNGSGLTPAEMQTRSVSAALNSSDLLTTQTQMQSESATLNSSGLPTTASQTQGFQANLISSNLTNPWTESVSPSLNSSALSTTKQQPESLTASLNTALLTNGSYIVSGGDTWATITQKLYGTSDPNAVTALENVEFFETLSAGTPLTSLPNPLSYTTTTTVTVPPYYTVQAGDSWSSIAQRLYGNSSSGAAAALQTAMGNPALNPGTQLTNFPGTINYTVQLPLYFLVQSGETWATIAQIAYGTSDPVAVAALQTTLGNPALTSGAELTGFPTSLTWSKQVTVTVPPYYVAQSGDTWASITQSLYGTSDPNAIAALQAAESNPTLSAGVQLMNLPATLTWSDPVSVTVSPYYVVQSGDTWASIAGELYNSQALGSELQNALGNPTLTAGAYLTNLPGSLSETFTTSSVIPPNYTVGQGATWASVTAAIYGTSDPHAVAALQAALGNPTLTAGEQLALPSSLTFQPSTALALHPYYTVQAGDTWASITQAIYGSSDPQAAAALQSALGNPAHGWHATGRTPSQPPGYRDNPCSRLHGSDRRHVDEYHSTSLRDVRSGGRHGFAGGPSGSPDAGRGVDESSDIFDLCAPLYRHGPGALRGPVGRHLGYDHNRSVREYRSECDRSTAGRSRQSHTQCRRATRQYSDESELRVDGNHGFGAALLHRAGR